MTCLYTLAQGRDTGLCFWMYGQCSSLEVKRFKVIYDGDLYKIITARGTVI
jgi:hypothetical protein